MCRDPCGLEMSDLTEQALSIMKKQNGHGEATCWFGAWCCKNREVAADAKDVKHTDWTC